MTSSEYSEDEDKVSTDNNTLFSENTSQNALFELDEDNNVHDPSVQTAKESREPESPQNPEHALRAYQGDSQSVQSHEAPTTNARHSGSVRSDYRESVISKKALVIIGIALPVLSIALALVAAFLIVPQVENNRASNTLSTLWSQRGDATLMNTERVTFAGQNVSSADVEQKALVGGGVNADSAVFAFNNGHSNVDNRKVVDLYLDFGSQTSRDFFAYNENMLNSLIRSGQAEVRIHPVPTGSPLSMYAPETLAEMATNHPEKVWGLVMETMKIGPILETGTPQETAEAIITMLNNEMITDIDVGDVSDGTFSSWIIAVGDDENLGTGYYPPVIYVNGDEVSTDDVNINDSDALQKHILNRG